MTPQNVYGENLATLRFSHLEVVVCVSKEHTRAHVAMIIDVGCISCVRVAKCIFELLLT